MIKTEVRHEIGQNKACSIQCSIKSVKTDEVEKLISAGSFVN